MKNVILIANTAKDSFDYVRAETVLSIVARVISLEGQEYKISNAEGTQILQSIYALNGKLSFETQPNKIIAMYIPSFDAKKQLIDPGTNQNWDEGIIKKQQKSIRTTQGAIFRLPLENGQGNIDTFITDWSPFPVATAIAVHKDHSAIASVKKDKLNYFTGLFIRHPLTGDLIPVFVADWVKPEFGTGAVIINPAHSQVDLDFARIIGLPIRFGLIPHNVTADPATWPYAPVIKTGHTTKTGRYDNLSPEEAVIKYFDELQEFGHADRFTDIGVGAYPIFELEISENGEYYFDLLSGKLALVNSIQEESNSNIMRVNIIASPILNGISDCEPDNDIVLVAQSSELDGALLFSRCLYYDLYSKVLAPRRIHQVQKVQEAKSTENVDPSTLALSTIIQAPNNQIAVLKQQILEQAERFVKIHNEIKKGFETVTAAENEVNRGQYANIKALIVATNYQNAFNSLYAIQKNLFQEIRNGVADVQAIKLYFSLAYVLLGDNYPSNVSVSDEWNTL
jgi:hypothetical protein